jgi:hypothetical protein
MSAATDEVNLAGVYSFAASDIKQKENMQRKRTMKLSGKTLKMMELEEEEDVKEEDLYETEVLERAIVKIGYLLALGFGEAGAGIIG